MYDKYIKRIISMVLSLVLLFEITALGVQAQENLPDFLQRDPQTGLSALYEYETFDAGMAGVAYVNTYQGTLHLRRNDLTLGGNRMPVNIEFYFDPTNASTGNPYGSGWSTAYNQLLSYDSQAEKYAYKNENGTWLYFVNTGTVNDAGMEVWSEDAPYGVGLVGMELYFPATATNTNYAVADLCFGDTHFEFDSQGRLSKITEDVNTISIAYVASTGDAISCVTDPVGRKFCFNYTSGLLTSIVCKTAADVIIEGVSVQYTVTSGQLTQVSYSGDSIVSYSYDTNGNLIAAVGVDLCGYTFAYGQDHIVTQALSKAAMGTDAEASGHVTTIERTSDGTVTITSGDSQTEYTFDGCGRIASCELRQKQQAQAQSTDPQFQCVYGYNLTYGYVTDDNGAVINTVTDVENYDSNGVIEEEEPTPEDPEDPEPNPYTYTYDAYGNVLTETYTQGNLHQTSSYTYSADGNYLLSQTDENGNTVQYQYDLDSGLLEALRDANQNDTAYTYNALRELQSVQLDVTDLVNGTGMQAQYTYSQGRLTGLTYGAYTYGFTYDIWGNILAVTVNGSNLVSYTYGAEAYNGQVQTMTYGNGQAVNYTYNTLGQVSTVGYSGQANRFTYTYGEDGALQQIHDSVLSETTIYTETGFQLQSSDGTVIYSYTSDENGNSTEVLGSTTIQTLLPDDTSKRLLNAAGNELLHSSTQYDSLDRLTQKVNSMAVGNVTQSYTYKTNADGSASNLLESYSVAYTEGYITYIYSFAYTYDGNGNILSVTEVLERDVDEIALPGLNPLVPDDSIMPLVIPGEDSVPSDGTLYSHTTTYTYDEAGQLTRVYDANLGQEYCYDYDASGNITNMTVSNISSSGVQTLAGRKTFRYTNGILKKVSSSLDSVVTYLTDAMGNPIRRMEGTVTQAFTWGQGRMLTRVATNNGNYANYKYDASGLRRIKQVVTDGQLVTTEYVWGNNGLAGFVQGDNTVIILYDQENQPAGFTLNGVSYSYIKNLQGDVLKVLDSTGAEVVSYTYDPWGVPTATGDETLISLNPCTYRSYYYDHETGFYYLQSRYYDPATGRFLNADTVDYLGAGNKLTANNIYIYCGNSPAFEEDPTGHGPILGYGMQLCFSIGKLTVGLELLWKHSNKKFYVFAFVGGLHSGELSEKLTNIGKKITNKIKTALKSFFPKKLTDFAKLKSFGISASATIILGNRYASFPSSYCGWFTSASITVCHITVSGAIGYEGRMKIGSFAVGISSSRASWSCSQTYYFQLSGNDAFENNIIAFRNSILNEVSWLRLLICLS